MRRSAWILLGAAVAGAALTVSAFVVPSTASASALQPYPSCEAYLAQQRADLRERAYDSGILHTWPAEDFWNGYFGAPVDAPSTTANVGGASRLTRVVPSDQGLEHPQASSLDAPDGIAVVAGGKVGVLDGWWSNARSGTLNLLTAGPDPRPLASLDLTPYYGGEPQLLAVGTRLLVIGPILRAAPGNQAPVDPIPAKPRVPVADRAIIGGPLIVRYVPARGTRLMLFDTAEGRLRLVEQRIQDGDLLTARMSGDVVRLVTLSLPDVQGIDPDGSNDVVGKTPDADSPPPDASALEQNRQIASQAGLSAFLPRVVRTDGDGSLVEDGAAIGCDQILRPATGPSGALITVTALNPTRDLATVDSAGLAAQSITARALDDRLYLAVGSVPLMPGTDDSGVPLGPWYDQPAVSTMTTSLYSFDTGGAAAARYLSSVTFDGNVETARDISTDGRVVHVAVSQLVPGTTSGASDVISLREDEGELTQAERVARTPPPGADSTGLASRDPAASDALIPVGDAVGIGLGPYAEGVPGPFGDTTIVAYDTSNPASPAPISSVSPFAGTRGPEVFVSTPVSTDIRSALYDPVRGLLLVPYTVYDGIADEQAHWLIGISVDVNGRLSVSGRIPLSRVDIGEPKDAVLDAGRVLVSGIEGVAALSVDPLALTGETRIAVGPPSDCMLPSDRLDGRTLEGC